ncbi:MAG: hypothetical protein ACJA0C_001491 [Candidatus Endobugula sp.]
MVKNREKNMPLEWNVNNTDSPRYLHQAVCNEPNEAAIKDVIDGSIERAIDCLHENIQDDSLYFLVEWNDAESSLTIIVTDDSKQKESPHKIVSDFSRVMGQEIGSVMSHTTKDSNVDIDKIQYWVRDFLTTSTGFIRFSLVAIFSRGDRNNTLLM